MEKEEFNIPAAYLKFKDDLGPGDGKKCYGILMEPDGKNTKLKPVIINDPVSLDELYKHMDCDYVATMPLAKDSEKPVPSYKLLVIYDECFLIRGTEPKVNYLASVLTSTTLCGKTMLLLSGTDENGGLCFKPIPHDLTDFYGYVLTCVQQRIPADTEIEVPVYEPPKVLSFDSFDEMMGHIKELEGEK